MCTCTCICRCICTWIYNGIYIRFVIYVQPYLDIFLRTYNTSGAHPPDTLPTTSAPALCRAPPRGQRHRRRRPRRTWRAKRGPWPLAASPPKLDPRIAEHYKVARKLPKTSPRVFRWKRPQIGRHRRAWTACPCNGTTARLALGGAPASSTTASPTPPPPPPMRERSQVT